MSVARLWKLRQRFGIAAPRVAVRTHVPWYLRWLGLALVLAISGASAIWIYDTGRRFAGFEHREAEQEIASMRRERDAASAELSRLKDLAGAAESRIAIERTAQQNLAKQLRAADAETARLREELAVFERMFSTDPKKAAPLSIPRFKVEPELLPGEFRFHLLLLAMGPRRADFQGRYELVVNLTEDGRDVMMTLPPPGAAGDHGFDLGFKHFQRIQGTFRVNPGAQVKSVQVRVYEAGASQARATQTATLG